MPGEAERRLRAKARALAAEADRLRARLKAIECDVLSLRTAVTLLLDELDALIPITGHGDR